MPLAHLATPALVMSMVRLLQVRQRVIAACDADREGDVNDARFLGTVMATLTHQDRFLDCLKIAASRLMMVMVRVLQVMQPGCCG